MIHIYRTQSLLCEHVQSLQATSEHIQQLVAQYQIPSDFFSDALDLDKRPRIEHFAQSTLLLMHIPQVRPDVQATYDDVKYRTIPFAIIFGPDYFITVSKQHQQFEPDFFQNPVYVQKLASAEHLDVKQYALLHLLQAIALDFTQFITHIEAEILAAENELSRSYRNQELYTLLYLNESLLYTTTSLKQIIQLLQSTNVQAFLVVQHDDCLECNMLRHETLEHETQEPKSQSTEGLAQCFIEFEQAHSVAEINQLNLNNVMDAYGNVIQNNVSHVVKLLTAVTIVLSVPTLIASVYGMNVPLPFQDAEHAFSVIIILMLCSSVAVSYYFYKKQYF